MKFFTPNLINRFGSEDDRIAVAAHQEFEERSEGYSRQLHEIEDRLPQRFGELLNQFYMHDSRVISHSSFGISDQVGRENRSWRRWSPGGTLLGRNKAIRTHSGSLFSWTPRRGRHSSSNTMRSDRGNPSPSIASRRGVSCA